MAVGYTQRADNNKLAEAATTLRGQRIDVEISAFDVTDPYAGTAAVAGIPALSSRMSMIGAAMPMASDASSFVNGHPLYVDGGMTESL